jgi:hypothetical protein
MVDTQLLLKRTGTTLQLVLSLQQLTQLGKITFEVTSFAVCWMRMPSGCSRTLSQITTSLEWFRDKHYSVSDAASCLARVSAFNSWCGRSDTEHQWGWPTVMQHVAVSFEFELGQMTKLGFAVPTPPPTLTADQEEEEAGYNSGSGYDTGSGGSESEMEVEDTNAPTQANSQQLSLSHFSFSRMFGGLAASVYPLSQTDTTCTTDAVLHQHKRMPNQTALMSRVDYQVNYPASQCAYSGLPLSQHFGAVHDGWFKADSTGLYSFRVESNDASQLVVANLTLLQTSGAAIVLFGLL